MRGGQCCGPLHPPPPLPRVKYLRRSPSPQVASHKSSSSFLAGRCGNSDMAGNAGPKRQDTRKFVENLSGEGKCIAVLTSGGDAQGKKNKIKRRAPQGVFGRTCATLKAAGSNPCVSARSRSTETWRLDLTDVCTVLKLGPFCDHFIKTTSFPFSRSVFIFLYLFYRKL